MMLVGQKSDSLVKLGGADGDTFSLARPLNPQD